MANTYLTVDFKEKDAAKSLGARWDVLGDLVLVAGGMPSVGGDL